MGKVEVLLMHFWSFLFLSVVKHLEWYLLIKNGIKIKYVFLRKAFSNNKNNSHAVLSFCKARNTYKVISNRNFYPFNLLILLWLLTICTAPSFPCHSTRSKNRLACTQLWSLHIVTRFHLWAHIILLSSVMTSFRWKCNYKCRPGSNMFNTVEGFCP